MMTRDEILNSQELKAQFVKDNGLPITVLQRTHFQQRLNLLNSIFNCKAAFNQYCQDLQKYETPQEYFNMRENMLSSTLQNLTDPANKSLKDFHGLDLHRMLGDIEPLSSGEKRAFYNIENCGRIFARIRLKYGALTAVNHFEPRIFGADTPESALPTLDKHMRTSVEVWETISDVLGRGRLAQLMTIYLSIAADVLTKFLVAKRPNSYIASGLLLEVPADAAITLDTIDQYKQEVESALATLPDNLGECFECEIFQLEEIESYGFMEEYYRKKPAPVRFIGVDPNLYHILATYYLNKEDPLRWMNQKIGYFLPEYLVINYDGRLAALAEPPKNPFRR